MTRYYGSTGVFHSKVHPKMGKNCPGLIVYNGGYYCDLCGKVVACTPELYYGLFVGRYPEGNYEDHPNFDKQLFELGKQRTRS